MLEEQTVANQRSSHRNGVCSIIIPIYNRERFIAETVHSCLLQDYPLVEVVLVDDGSRDRTPEICARLAALKRADEKTVRYVRQENAGACVARNRGLSIATGEFVLFLDSDDLIPPTKLSRQISEMEQHRADCSICDFSTIDQAGQPIAYYSNALQPIEFIARLRSPSNSAIVMRRISIPSNMQWNVALSRMQDFDFMLRYLSGVRKWVYVPDALYLYRIHDEPRISDSYLQGMPYREMFFSMQRHLSVYPPATTGKGALLARYGAALLKARLKDEGSRRLPASVKKVLNSLIRK